MNQLRWVLKNYMNRFQEKYGKSGGMIGMNKKIIYEILGKDLTEEFIKDQFNMINDLDDPYQEDDHSGRVGLEPLKLAVKILDKLAAALEEDFVDLHNKIITEINNLSEEEANDINKIMEVANVVKQSWKGQA